MAYVCPRCDTVYHSRPDDGCQGSRRCARGGEQTLTWYPNTTVQEAERSLREGTLRDTPEGGA